MLDAPLPDDEPGGGGAPHGHPWLVQEHATPAARRCAPAPSRVPRTVFVAGDLGPDPALGRKLAAFAARARVPLLADPLSGARSGPAAIAHFDLILRDPETAAAAGARCRLPDRRPAHLEAAAELDRGPRPGAPHPVRARRALERPGLEDEHAADRRPARGPARAGRAATRSSPTTATGSTAGRKLTARSRTRSPSR